MRICSSCGKPIEGERTTCHSCGGTAMTVDGDSVVAATFRRPWVQTLLVIIVALLAYVTVKSMVAKRAPVAVSSPSPEVSAAPSPKATGKPSPGVSLPPDKPDAQAPDGGDEAPLSGMIPPLPFVGPDPSQLTPTTPGTAAPEVTAEPDVSMPADVRNWLNHLASIESERQNLATQQLAASTALAGSAMNSPDGGAADYANAAIVVRAAWADLSERFTSETVPPECATIRSLYVTTLNGTRALMTDLMSAMRSAARNPERAVVQLTRIRDEGTQRVDQPAETTDEAIDDLCGRYQMDKWFDIDNRVADRLISQMGL